MTDVRSRGGPWLRSHGHWLIPIVVIGALFAPMLLTQRAFWVDNSNHLWLIGERQRDFGFGWPSYFVSSDRTGIFYPVFAFYGGGVYSALGALGAALGDRVMVANLASWLLPFVMAYGGFTWLSYQLGVRGWRAQVPGLVLVSSAYYLTNVYGRGAWGETVATSTIPLLCASGLWLLRNGTWRVGPVLAFALSAVVFTGSHNITLVWGSIVLVAVAAVVVWAFWPDVKGVLELRRVGRLVALAVICAGVNAAFLLPTLAYSRRTAVGHIEQPFIFTSSLFDQLFDPVRTAPGGTTASLYLQLPVIVLAWVAAFLVVVVLRSERTTRPIRRVVIGLAAIEGVLLTLLLWDEPWRHLPRVLTVIQFAPRLITFFVLILAALLVISLRVVTDLSGGVRRVWETLLVVALAYGFALGVWQVWSSESALPSREAALPLHGYAPETWYDIAYFDASQPVVAVPDGRGVLLDPTRESRGTFERVVDPPRGRQPTATNIAAGPYLVELDGVEAVGRTGGTTRPMLVVRRPVGNPRGPVHLRVRTAGTWPIVVGRVLSAASLLALVSWIGAVTWMRARERRTRRPSAAS